MTSLRIKKVLEDKNNKIFKVNRLERSMEEAVSKFQSLVEVDQLSGGPQKNAPWQKIKN